MELLHREHVLQDVSNDAKDLFHFPFLAGSLCILKKYIKCLNPFLMEFE